MYRPKRGRPGCPPVLRLGAAAGAVLLSVLVLAPRALAAGDSLEAPPGAHSIAIHYHGQTTLATSPGETVGEPAVPAGTGNRRRGRGLPWYGGRDL